VIDYQAIQEQLRCLHLEIGELAAQIGNQAEALRHLAEAAEAIAERRSLLTEAVAQTQCQSTWLGECAALPDKLAALNSIQTTACERYEQLTLEERVGQIPPPTVPTESAV
jgi:hypothetical protein